MPRFAYVNDRYVRHASAQIHVEDRGYQFADSVYEVVTVYDGKMVDTTAHWDRLKRSLDRLNIPMPKSSQSLGIICRELIRRNQVTSGLIYLQASRGISARDHLIAGAMTPTLVVTCRNKQFRPLAVKNLRIRTVPDERWARVDIKTVGLLPNSMAKSAAVADGFDDAWMVDRDGMVTEGTSSNAWIVKRSEAGQTTLITRHVSQAILNGITKLRVKALSDGADWHLEERAFSVAEARAADEAFLTSATSFVAPVVAIDGHSIGTGDAGPITQAIQQHYFAYMLES